MTKATIILIAGPTASGKSALALELAHKNNGVIINTDALQIYAGLPLLSAQPTSAMQGAVPHRLYGVVEPEIASSAGAWLNMARQATTAALTEGKTPILVGGTGLYFRAFFGGLSDIPAIPTEIREKAQKLYDSLGDPAFRRELARLDPESAARLAANDRQRLIRAYEVALHTGKPLSYWHTAESQNTQNNQEWDIVPHLLMPPRDELYDRCNARLQMMIKNSAREEVQAFLQHHPHVPKAAPVLKTIGFREIVAHLAGDTSLPEALVKAQQATRNYAKRQMTWFRNQWRY